MLNFFKKWTPLLMVFFTAIGLVLHYNDANMFSAYITGFTGWLIVAMHELFPESRKVQS
jgi:uncharacterized membrane protein YjjP (DUF1212 family)